MVGQKSDQMRIGLSFDRRRTDIDLRDLPLNGLDKVLLGSRDNLDLDNHGKFLSENLLRQCHIKSMPTQPILPLPEIRHDLPDLFPKAPAVIGINKVA